jgi:hypothetical protein
MDLVDEQGDKKKDAISHRRTVVRDSQLDNQGMGHGNTCDNVQWRQKAWNQRSERFQRDETCQEMESISQYGSRIR